MVIFLLAGKGERNLEIRSHLFDIIQFPCVCLYLRNGQFLLTFYHPYMECGRHYFLYTSSLIRNLLYKLYAYFLHPR